MSSTAARIVAGIAIFLTVVLAVVGYRVSHRYAEQSGQEQQVRVEEDVPRILAVIAVKPLAAYREIQRDDVVLAEISVAPKNYYTTVDDVVGKSPLVDVDQGAPVTRRYFAEGNHLARSIPSGYQAISVEVSDIVGVGGFVRPGDVVDVLLYLRGTNDVSTTQARVLLEQTRVLAYEEMLVDRPEGLEDQEQSSSRGSRRQRTAVLAVPEKKTTRLMLGASLGELRLSLHGLPGNESDPLARTRLPLSDEALKAAAAKKVPDMALTAAELSRVKKPPAKKQVVRPKVVVYRGSQVETVRP